MSERGVTVINGSDSGGSQSNSRSSSPGKKAQGEEERPKRFQNGWSREQERLMAEWSDIAICYRWLHDRSDKIYHIKTLMVSLPVIILSTVSGFSNIGVQAIIENQEAKKFASFMIAAISLAAGLLTTIGDRLRYAQLEESHRVAAIAWGKFQRLIAVELAVNPNDRMDAFDFLKICRADLDRLIEQSPAIPKEAISMFENNFGKIRDLKKPDICGALEHTTVFVSSEERLKQMAVEASLMLRRKKQTLTELVSPQIERKIADQVDRRLAEAIEDRKRRLEEEIDTRKRDEQIKLEEEQKILEERRRKIQEELDLEKKRLFQEPTLKVVGSQFENRLNFRRESGTFLKQEFPKKLVKPPIVPSIIEESQPKNTIILPNQTPSRVDSGQDEIIIVSKQ
jgi:hypothetical protein